MGNMGICGPILGQKGGFIPPNRPSMTLQRTQRGVIEVIRGGTPPFGVGLTPKRAKNPPFLCHPRGYPWLTHFTCRFLCGKCLFVTLIFPEAAISRT